VLPLRVLLVRVGEEPYPQDTPPPSYAELPLMVLLVRVGEELLQHTPPPSP
jgi:hypothetical protein